jgi:hypothetical protein
MPERSRRTQRQAASAWLRMLRTIAAGLLLAVAAGGCVQREVRDVPVKAEPDTPWQTVLAQAKAFTLRIGFVPTANFMHVSQDVKDFPFCGRASRLVLPYSYEDPAIEWLEAVSEAQCRSAAPAMDVYHGMSEAIGEVASPVTPAMIASGVPRMIYLVVHEDCHDQFSLPYGIEEPLCETLSYHAMKAIAAQPGPWNAAERRAILDYAVVNTAQIALNLRYYQQVALLYARHARGELREEALLHDRAAVFARAEASGGGPAGSINNVVLANRMTYARHHAFMERTFERLGSDLGRMVAFFQQVDADLAEAAQAAESATPADTGEPAAAPGKKAAPVRPPPARDTGLKSGPRQRPVPPPRIAVKGRSTGGARPTRPPARSAVGPEASATSAAKEKPETDTQSPAQLLARIQAFESQVLDAATRRLAELSKPR